MFALYPAWDRGLFILKGESIVIAQPMDVLKQYPIRKKKTHKQTFRDDVKAYVESLGYPVAFEKGSYGARNIVIGDPENAKYLITAHYDTPASIGIPNFLTPCNPVVYIIYQIFVVAIFFLMAFLVGFPVMLLTNDTVLTFWAAYIAYFGLLFLMLLGPANKNNANDNTSGVVTVLETARTMPESLREKVCFVLFDLEEAGLIGSASYRKAHKAETEKQIVLNLDCVGDGNEIVFFPTKKLRKDGRKLQWLYKAIGRYGDKTIDVREKGFATYPSDQKHFPYGVGIAALKRKKGIGLYLDRIHTRKDTRLDQTNVNLLRACLTSLITEVTDYEVPVD